MERVKGIEPSFHFYAAKPQQIRTFLMANAVFP